MQMTHVVKINDKIFTIVGYTDNIKATCPDDETCYINKISEVVLHRDDEGKIQSEKVVRW